MTSRAILVALALFCPGVASAQHPRWEAPLPLEPFDRTPFRPIGIPKWVEETTGVGYTLSVLNADARASAVARGVTISEVGFVDPIHVYYDSKFLKKRNPAVPLDRVASEIAAYKKLGLRVLGVYPPTLQGEVYEAHPDWRRVTSDTNEIPSVDMKQYPHGGMLCLLGPYGDFLIDVLAEIATKFPEVDAFSFDGLHHGGFCRCEHCRAAYRAETGKAIPKANLDDLEFRRYQYWADRRLENLIRRMQSRLKGIKPDLALVTWTTNAGRFGHFLSLPRNMPSRMNLLLDAPDQEFWLDESNRGATIVPAFANAYIWATTNHRVAFSEPYLMSHGNPYGKDSFPPHEVLRRMMLALTHGASPSIAVIQPPRLRRAVDDGLEAVKARKPWLTHKKPEPWAALLMSDNTRTFGGRSAGKVEERYMAGVFGAFRALIEEHVPTAVINDWNLNDADLAPYRVLVLPNAMCLDDRAIAAIGRFVERGGGLVATSETSLLDEFGEPRKEFGLASILGVSHPTLPVPATSVEPRAIDSNFALGISADYWEKRKNVFDFRLTRDSFLLKGRLATYIGDESVTFKGPALRTKVDDPKAIVAATLRVNPGNERTTEDPAVVARSVGRGRVVYLPAGIDAAYYLYAYPYQRLVLRGAFDFAAGDASPPVVVEAPMCVQTSLMRQTKNGERLLVHLFNDVNTTAHHALPGDDVPLREEVLPIHDIRLTFRPEYRLGRVHLEPEGIDLPVRSTPAGSSVVVPKLEIHSIVVTELPGR